MDEKPLDQTNVPAENEPEILVNDYGDTRDSAVVIDEASRTVLLTQDETIVIDKEPRIDVVPVNRPRKVYGGMWGPAELVTIAFAMVALFIVAMLYIFMVAPANRELEATRAKRDGLERELISARNKYGDIRDTETQVSKLMASVDDFESRYLPVASSGRTSMYQRINSLIRGYGLINTSGPDYSPLETADLNNGAESDGEKGRAKYKSLFPGVYVTMTVEGSYQNIRRFIREVETGNDFVVVSAVELEPTDGDGGPRQQNPQNQAGPVIDSAAAFPPGGRSNNPNGAATGAPISRPKGKSHGEVVSLRLEMAAYFRRPNVVTQAPTEQQN
ncbi:MAG TPA: hypothetical protein VMZ26_06705 [Pyrinomonadaceae bacterium]|nr:hypothetical protein [Pyrinomonadaceae bacterium]